MNGRLLKVLLTSLNISLNMKGLASTLFFINIKGD